ncbi:nuclease [Alsobacter soli]|uniref:Nuclease n=1 Tax=Alsobacter soli TaxID=2109933 RepID=A0A2T1HW45_9HYPH|nr:nuclease [Alsobacter soli]PSC05883.1 nuclease [Alsobacter soli]
MAELAVTAEGDLAAPDGRIWTPAGIAWSAAASEPSRRARLSDFSRRGPFRAAPLAGRPDRWGRMPAWITGADGELSAMLVGEGLAAARPGEVPAGCVRRLLALEEEARRAGRGAWSDPGAKLDAAEPQAILAQAGRYALVEGLVLGTSERKTRAYLNFGPVWSEDFTVTVSKRTLNRIEASGMRWSSLRGRRIRVRGVVAESGGPLIELNAPEDIERID